MSPLIAVRAKEVQPGDLIDMASLTVDAVVSGQNGQTYLVCTSGGGAPVVLERDPDESVSVRRAEIVAEFEHIWPVDGLRHAPCVRCGTPYGPDAGTCTVVLQDASVRR